MPEMDKVRLVLNPAARIPENAEPATWLRPRLLPWGPQVGTSVGAVIPTGFERYARVFHPAMAGASRPEPVTWSTVAEWAGKIVHPEMQWEAISLPGTAPSEPRPWEIDPSRGDCPINLRAALVDIFESVEPSARDCWACIWEGFAGVEEALENAPSVHHPSRNYFLIRAPIETIRGNILSSQVGTGPTPGIWWPDDQAWCVATAVDFMWTYVAGTSAMIERLLADPRVEALPTTTAHRGDHLSDQINGTVEPEL